jgi:hypothetical protein
MIVHNELGRTWPWSNVRPQDLSWESGYYHEKSQDDLLYIFRPSMTSSDGSYENEWMTFLLHYPAAALITPCCVTFSACGIYWLNVYLNQLIYSMLQEEYSYFIKHELPWFCRGHPAVFLKIFKTIRHKQPHSSLPHYMKSNPQSVSAVLWHTTHPLFSVVMGNVVRGRSHLFDQDFPVSFAVFKVSRHVHFQWRSRQAHNHYQISWWKF